MIATRIDGKSSYVFVMKSVFVALRAVSEFRILQEM